MQLADDLTEENRRPVDIVGFEEVDAAHVRQESPQPNGTFVSWPTSLCLGVILLRSPRATLRRELKRGPFHIFVVNVVVEVK